MVLTSANISCDYTASSKSSSWLVNNGAQDYIHQHLCAFEK